MQLSKYTIFVDDYPNAGESLIFHSRTQALVKINAELRNILIGLSENDLISNGFRKDDLESLHSMGFLVRDEAEDQELLERFMEQKKYGINQAYFLATILTTYNCNFACTYCFEESTRTSAQKLDRPTSDLIIQWLKRKVEKLGVRALELNYYGGEPLLNQTAIEYISGEMKPWCESKGVVFRAVFQTNGMLLTPQLVDRFIPLGLVAAQVSLDGVKAVHDAQRPMRGTGKGTFETVIENLKAVADKIRIVIAAGYDKGDPEGLIELLDYLDAIGLLKKIKKFTYSPIHPSLGPQGHAEDIVAPACMSNYDKERLLPADQRIKDVMRQKGLPVKSGLSTSMCQLNSGDSGVTIDTQGLIFKCNAMLGHPKLAVGNVREEGYNEVHKRFLDSDAWKKCDGDCPYAPLCNSGCRLFSFFKTQDFMAKSCERSYMDQFVPQAIKKEYDIRKAQQKIEMPLAAPLAQS